MSAIAVEKSGDDHTMMTLPTPEPGPGEVQVREALARRRAGGARGKTIIRI